MEAKSWEPVAPGRIENLTVVQSSTQSESSSAKQLFFSKSVHQDPTQLASPETAGALGN